jgi:thioredoxin 1
MTVTAITDSSFEAEVLQADVPVLVEFGADWCQPCRQIEPILEELSAQREGTLRIVSMNVDEQPITSTSLGVTGLPTLMMFRDGLPVLQLIGARPRAVLVAEVDRALTS